MTYQLNEPCHFDILRSVQKDDYYRKNLHASLASLVKSLFEHHRVPATIARRVEALADLLYYAVTTLLNRQTVGQEYYNLLLLRAGTPVRALSALRRVLLVFLKVTLPYILYETAARSTQLSSHLRLALVFVRYLVQLNLVCFYLGNSTYFNIEERITRTKLASLQTSSINTTRRIRYLLGTTHLLTLIVQIVGDVRAHFSNKSMHNDVDACVVIASTPSSASRRCALCLDTLTAPTSTPCGHIFCWKCINQYVQVAAHASGSAATCPSCRLIVDENKLIYMHNFNL